MQIRQTLLELAALPKATAKVLARERGVNIETGLGKDQIVNLEVVTKFTDEMKEYVIAKAIERALEKKDKEPQDSSADNRQKMFAISPDGFLRA